MLEFLHLLLVGNSTALCHFWCGVTEVCTLLCALEIIEIMFYIAAVTSFYICFDLPSCDNLFVVLPRVS